MPAEEALRHGVVSRVVAPEELDATVREIAEQVATAPAVAVKMARTVIAHLSRPQIRASMDDEMIYQTFVNRSDDAAELRAARAEDREPALHRQLSVGRSRPTDHPPEPGDGS